MSRHVVPYNEAVIGASLLLVIGLLAGFLGGFLAKDVTGPGCPTEGSREIDYRDGQWHITEVTP